MIGPSQAKTDCDEVTESRVTLENAVTECPGREANGGHGSCTKKTRKEPSGVLSFHSQMWAGSRCHIPVREGHFVRARGGGWLQGTDFPDTTVAHMDSQQ